MSNLWLFIIVIGALVLVGAFISLLALLWPVRRSCQRSLAVRGAVLCVLGLMSFVIGFGGLTWLGAQVTYYGFGTVVIDTFEPGGARVARTPEAEAKERLIVRELWVRLLLPPSLRQRCYTSEAWVCNEVDEVVPATSNVGSWSSYLRLVGMGSVSAIASSMLVWLFTRRRR